MVKMLFQGFEDVGREDLGFQVGLEQLCEGELPHRTMRFKAFLGVQHVHGIVRELVNESHQHLIGVEVAVQGDATDAVRGARRSEVAQLGVSRTIEPELET